MSDEVWREGTGASPSCKGGTEGGSMRFSAPVVDQSLLWRDSCWECRRLVRSFSRWRAEDRWSAGGGGRGWLRCLSSCARLLAAAASRTWLKLTISSSSPSWRQEYTPLSASSSWLCREFAISQNNTTKKFSTTTAARAPSPAASNQSSRYS